MGNILKMGIQEHLRRLISLGWTDRAISRYTNVHRTTIAKYRAQIQNVPKVSTDLDSEADPGFQSVPKVPTDSAAPPPTNSSVIVPHREYIRSQILLSLTARRIYQDLVEERAFTGSYDSVKRYVRKMHKRHPQYFERLPTIAGREAQVDFAKSPALVRVGDRYVHVWLFKMTLSHSKHSYEEHVLHQDIETFIRCHEHAFKWFGGVPEIVTLDNLKSGVLHAHLYDPQLNPVYAAFAEHWGFLGNPCAPRKPNHKGRVERDIQYTESNALARRKFESLDESNVFLRHWNKRWARTRIHGTAKCQVWKMFVETEQRALRPLAEKNFAFFNVSQRKVDVTGMVCVANNFYAVPHTHIGRSVSVHYNSDQVKILDEKQQLVISHRTMLGKGKVIQPASCRPPYKHPSLEHQEMYYCRTARTIGPSCLALVEKMLIQDHPLTIRRVRGVLSLNKRFDANRLETACAEALTQQVYQYHHLAMLCQTLPQAAVAPLPAITQEHELIRPLAEYQTIIEERSL
jgi:transposase